MRIPESRTQLDLLEASAPDSGCGCGGCRDGSAIDTSSADNTGPVAAVVAVHSVTGLTCGHCVSAVTSELQALDEVTGVTVDLVVGGPSTLTLHSTSPVEPTTVPAALAEAGAYHFT